MSISRNRNLLIIIAVLLLTNVGMLVYFLGKQKENKPDVNAGHGGLSVTEMLQKEVGFNEEQTVRYREMKEKQRERIRPMYDNMRKAKDSLFRLLSFPGTPDSVINKATDLIAQRQKEIDTETFNHFKRVRALCEPGQEANYDSMVLKMFRRMGKPPRPGEAHQQDKAK